MPRRWRQAFGPASLAACLALALAPSAHAAPPSARTSGALATGATTATVEGQVDPAGQPTEYRVAYDLASTQWCMSHDDDRGPPPQSTKPVTLSATDYASHFVTVELSGLSPGGEYCAELTAHNDSGAAHGVQVSFTAGSPSLANVSTGPATGATTATVEGQIDPAGQPTEYEVAYDLASSQWCESAASMGSPLHSTAPVTLGFTDAASHPVTVELSGLSSGSEYCAQLIAVNGSATARGFVGRFLAGLPAPVTLGVSPTGGTTVTVEGEVDPAGQSTTYWVGYDVAGSQWCTSHGSSGSPAYSTPQATLSFTDALFHTISIEVSGLAPAFQYCMELIAHNASGTTSSPPISFTAGAPSASISLHEGTKSVYDVFATGPGTETVEGLVNPAGQNTSDSVVYDQASSLWCSSGGSMGLPLLTTIPVPLGYTDTASHPVTVELRNLVAKTEYCAQLIAVNPSATARSSIVSFTAGAPFALTLGASATSPTTASIEAELNPAGQPTDYEVAYDLASSSEWCRSSGSAGEPAFLTSPVPLSSTEGFFHVSIPLSGLTTGSEYCAELIAVNATDTAHGGQQRLTAGVPSALTGVVFATGPTTATLEGEVNPAGQSTRYEALYGLASSKWCKSLGLEGAAESFTAGSPLGVFDGTPHVVSVALSGLTAEAEYCAELIAVNLTATVHGGQVEFAAGSARPAIMKVSPTTGATAGGNQVTITGTNLEGATAVHFGPVGATIKTDTATEITVESPAQTAGQVDVTVTTPVGTSAISEADRFTYQAPPLPIPTPEGSTTGSGNSVTPPLPVPILAQSQTAGVVSGTVTVKLGGTSTFVTLSGSQSIPDGSEVDATNGRVVIYVKTPTGQTVSAELFGGRFLVHQNSRGETRFTLTLQLLGCPRVALPRGSAAHLARAAAKRRSGPKSRHLWVSERGGSWGTTGRYVSTSVEGTTWLTVDECTRSQVTVTAGRVKVHDLARNRTTIVTAGHHYVASRPSRRRHRR